MSESQNVPAIPFEAQLAEFQSKSDGKRLTNIDYGKEPGRSKVAAIESGYYDYTEADVGDDPFSITSFHMQWVHDVPNESGELTSFVRSVLVRPDGMTVKFGSGGVADSIRALIRAFGPGPWNPPILVQLKRTPAKKGKRFMLIPVLNEREE